jgi:hypothetical protein
MSMWMYACMTIMMQCNLSKIKRNRKSGTHIYGSSCFTTRHFNCWLAWQRQSMGALHKIKWSGENIISIAHILHILLIMWGANYHVTTWCEMQIVVWMAYSDSSHFSDKISYKILFISSYGSKDMILPRFAYLQEF